MDLWNARPEALVGAMREAGLRRAYLVTDPETRKLRGSHPLLDPVLAAVQADRRDYDLHEGCFFEIGRQSGHLLAAFLHKTRRGQGAGGVRYWSYERLEDFVRDGLRLSRGMGHKCALAGLWWGGGKGVIARRPGLDHTDPQLRRAVYGDYGRFVSSLAGCYVTAEDVGTTAEDMATIFTTTRHTSCIPPALGGSGNPSQATARGVVVAIEAALDHLGAGSLAHKTVATQGLGNVASFMIRELLDRGVARIVGTDIDQAAIERLREAHPPDAPLDLRQVASGDTSVLAEPCDVLSLNAVGAMLNPRTIGQIRARVVCGGANNQLEDPVRDAPALAERKVLYVPDFLANRMGIVNCANEQYGWFDGDLAIAEHLDRQTPHGVYRRCLEVFDRAGRSGKTTAEEAQILADELAEQPHPIWGHRGQQIIDHLVASGWDRLPDA